MGRVTGDPGDAGRSLRSVHWVRQVHGSTVVVVPSEAPRGAGGTESGRARAVLAGHGDALVSSGGRIGLVILTADCASVALGSPEGVLGAVHAGWRGLADGVVEQAVETMGTLGATEVVGAVGPCIHPGCYEFSESDLDRVAARLGDGARSRTASGRPALDIPAAVSAALRAAGVTELGGVDACTGCAGGYFSHRARGDGGRQALLVWTSAVDR